MESMNWDDLYSDHQIRKWGLPHASARTRDGEVRQLLIQWQKLQAQWTRQEPVWFMACDVLVLDQDMELNHMMRIFARRVEVAHGAALNINGRNPRLDTILVTREIVAMGSQTPCTLTLNVFDETLDTATPILLDSRDRDGEFTTTAFYISPEKDHLEQRVLDPAGPSAPPPWYRDMGSDLQEGEPLRLALITQFQTAVLLSSEYPKEAMDQLEFISHLAALPNPALELANQARGLILGISARQEIPTPVPGLDFNLYAVQARDMMEWLRQRIDTYQHLLKERDDAGRWAKQAQATLAFKSNERQLTAQLVTQAQDALDSAKQARRSGTRNLLDDLNTLDARKMDFDIGIEKWKHHQTIKAAFSLVKHSVEFIAQAAIMVVTAVAAPEVAAPAAGGQIAGGASGMLSKVKDNVSANLSNKEVRKKLTDQAKGAASSAEGMVDDVMKIIEISQTANQMQAMGDSVVKALDTATQSTFSTLKLTGVDQVTGGSQLWDKLLITVDAIFEGNDQWKEIEGGMDFRTAFRHVVVSAKALCQTKLAVARRSSKVVETTLKAKSAQAAQNIAQSQLEYYTSDENRAGELMQIAFWRILDAKRAVYLELDTYLRAVAYYTQRRPEQLPPLPTLTAPVDEFSMDCAKLTSIQLVVDELKERPSKLTRLKITLPLDDPQVNLRPYPEELSVVADIPPELGLFSHLYRVRIDTVEITPRDPEGNPLMVREIHLTTSGYYQDRDKSARDRLYAGDPYQRTILFDDQGNIILETSSIDRFKEVYFKPTPFCQWTLTVKAPQAVYQEISALEMRFSGEGCALNN